MVLLESAFNVFHSIRFVERITEKFWENERETSFAKHNHYEYQRQIYGILSWEIMRIINRNFHFSAKFSKHPLERSENSKCFQLNTISKFFRRTSLNGIQILVCDRILSVASVYEKYHTWLSIVSRWIIDITNNTPYLSLQKRIRPLWMNAERAVCDWQLQKRSLQMVEVPWQTFTLPYLCLLIKQTMMNWFQTINYFTNYRFGVSISFNLIKQKNKMYLNVPIGERARIRAHALAYNIHTM